MQENAGQVMEEWAGRKCSKKARSWPVLAQGMRMLIGLMLIALL